ncbi:oligosaccharide flippase family protein [Intestinibacter bartlettii]|uniref:oligosaccharide flippase family protein n=1 Tax=Intestinibacter bartlettii TaxID=261299 RepID=UPI003521BB6E
MRKEINELKLGAILSYVSLFIGNLISILYTPIALRMLGQSEYGLISLSSSTVSYLSLLSFGIGTSYIRYNTKYRVEKDKEGEYRLNGMYLIINIILSIILCIAGLILIINIDNIFKYNLTSAELQKTKLIMGILIINMAISFIMNVFMMNINAYEKFIVFRLISIISTIITPLVNIPLLFMGVKSVGLTLSSLVLSIIGFIVQVIYCFKVLNIKFIFNKFDKQILKEIFIFSSFMFLNSVTDQITFNTDKFLLGIYSGTAAVAIYTVGAQFNNYYLSFSTSISNVFIPRINQMVLANQNEEDISDLFIRIGRIQYIILALILSGYIIFGKRFVYFLAGDGYEDAFYIGLVLLISITVPCIQNIGLEILKAKNMHKYRSIVYFCIAVFNVFISIPMCKVWGGIGCALGTTISMILGTVVFMNIYYYKKIYLDIPKFWIEIVKMFKGLVIPIIFGIFMLDRINQSNLIEFFILGIIYVLIYSICCYILSMNQYEKNLIRDPILRMKGRLLRG